MFPFLVHLRRLKLLFNFCKFQCTSHQQISVANFGSRFHRAKVLISSFLQSLSFLNFELEGHPPLRVRPCFISVSGVTEPAVLSCDLRRHTFSFHCLIHSFYELIYEYILQDSWTTEVFVAVHSPLKYRYTYSDHSAWLNVINTSTMYTVCPVFFFTLSALLLWFCTS